MTSPLDRLRAALNVADDKAWPMTWLYTKDLAWALKRLDKEQAMNDNDVDDQARVLAFDDLTAVVAEAIEGMPAAMTETGPLDHHRIARAFSHGIARVAVEAVLASGVVVLARDVKSVADEWEAYHWQGLGRWRITFRQAAARLRSLLREPATDAAPDGEQQARGCDAPEVLHIGHPTAACGETGKSATAHSICVRMVAWALNAPARSRQSHTDATEPADPYPSDPQTVTNAQEAP